MVSLGVLLTLRVGVVRALRSILKECKKVGQVSGCDLFCLHVKRQTLRVVRVTEVDEVVQLRITGSRYVELRHELRNTILFLAVEDRVVIKTSKDRSTVVELLMKLAAGRLVEQHEREDRPQVAHGNVSVFAKVHRKNEAFEPLPNDGPSIAI